MIVDCAAYCNGQRVTGTLSIPEIAEWVGRPDTFVWIGLRVPSKDELQAAVAACAADVGEVAELLEPHDRPGFGIHDGATSLVLRTAHIDPGMDSVLLGELTVLIGDSYVISVRHGRASPLSTTRAELEADPGRMRLGPTMVLAAICERVVLDYGPVLDWLERSTIDVEREILDDSNRSPVRRLYRIKRELREFTTATDSLDDPMERLIRVRRGQWPIEVTNYLEETNDVLDRGTRRAASLSRLLDSAFSTLMAETSNQQNADMRKISAWVAIAAVPTAIAAIYGMNFDDMPELHWSFGYPAVLIVMGTSCALLYRAFRKSGWL